MSFLSLIKHSGVIIPYILDLALDESKWSTSCFGQFTLRETAFGAHWIGGWVGSRAGLGAVDKIKISAPLPIIKPRFLCHLAYSLLSILKALLKHSLDNKLCENSVVKVRKQTIPTE
jgi:hypothetical protein